MEILDRKVSAGVFFSASSTSANLTLGATINIYVKVEDRQFFAVSPYVTLSRAATAVNWATAKVENYNKTTGLLTLKLEQVTGAGGPFNDWVITSMPAVAYLQQAIYDATVALRNQVAADRTVVDSDKKAAQTARGEAQSAASAAVTARNGSQQALADVRNIIAPPVATPTAPRLGQIWWDGSILRVYDGTSFVPTVTTSIGGRRFEQGTFGASPSGVITVSGGFSFAMVFLNGALLQEGPDYTASSPTITITNPQPGDRYYVDAYLEADATDYYTKEQVILLLAAQKTAALIKGRTMSKRVALPIQAAIVAPGYTWRLDLDLMFDGDRPDDWPLDDPYACLEPQRASLHPRSRRRRDLRRSRVPSRR
ncbi:hypothetical protein HGG76_11550 [Ochrobactrum tritici]|uniref:Uncharacterized protein n=1 Tax=Brucella tritici TaxID=94626 RepID=A0A7X6FSQ4_9HYPH|nr:hypothetical protein [Brucella tritici]